MEGKITAKQFAATIGCERTRIYAIFDCKSIDTDLLARISNVLDYNFLFEYFEDDTSCRCYLVIAEGDNSKMEQMMAHFSLKIVKTKSDV